MKLSDALCAKALPMRFGLTVGGLTGYCLTVCCLSGCGGASVASSTMPEAPRRECTAALRFEEPLGAQVSATQPSEVDADAEAPRTRVSLVLICENESTRRVLVGDEVGACFAIEAGDAVLRARCWWAGAGSLLEVRHVEGSLVVSRAAIDEHTGTGPLEEASRLDVPTDATVRPL